MSTSMLSSVAIGTLKGGIVRYVQEPHMLHIGGTRDLNQKPVAQFRPTVILVASFIKIQSICYARMHAL